MHDLVEKLPGVIKHINNDVVIDADHLHGILEGLYSNLFLLYETNVSRSQDLLEVAVDGGAPTTLTITFDRTVSTMSSS